VEGPDFPATIRKRVGTDRNRIGIGAACGRDPGRHFWPDVFLERRAQEPFGGCASGFTFRPAIADNGKITVEEQLCEIRS
jgi:hypothetical protein